MRKWSHDDGEIASFKITIKIVAVLVACQPNFDPVWAVNPGISPVDVPRGGAGATCSRTGWFDEIVVEPDHRGSGRGTPGPCRTSPPGRSTSAAGREILALASTTAI